MPYCNSFLQRFKVQGSGFQVLGSRFRDIIVETLEPLNL
jgi:hypothetical protein